MTPDEIAALDTLEADAAKLAKQFPQFTARIAWACGLARRLGGQAPTQDDRDAVLCAQSARIAELERRLGLTPDRVLAAERAGLAGK